MVLQVMQPSAQVSPVDGKAGRDVSGEAEKLLVESRKSAGVVAAITGSSALSRLAASGPTLLPTQIAEFVTSLSLLARVSLKSAAFFIEVVLEGAKYGTGFGLGLTRRALISAVGSARALHAIKSGEDWKPGELTHDDRDGFLAVLDRYTSLGIYLIHSSFTMAELFAMSGFYLVDASLKTGLNAANESVRLIDGIFGSNETSRALASFIGLVRRELLSDEEYAAATGGHWWGLAALTKALTTFAVVQNATYRRTAHTHRMRVLYDCTLLGEAEYRGWKASALIVGPGNFNKAKSSPHTTKALPAPPSAEPLTPPTEGLLASIKGRFSRDVTPRPEMAARRLSRASLLSGTGFEEPCFTDVTSPRRPDSLRLSPRQAARQTDSVTHDLQFLVGAECDSQSESDDDTVASTAGTVLGRTKMQRSQLPRDVQRVISNADDAGLRKGVVLEPASASKAPVRQVVRRQGPKGAREEIFEITTETVEVVETTTTVQQGASKPAQSGPFGFRKASPFKALMGQSASPARRPQVTRDDVEDDLRDLTLREREEQQIAEEEDWTQILSTPRGAAAAFANENRDGDDAHNSQVVELLHSAMDDGRIPTEPNGGPAASIAARSRSDMLEQPDQARQRLQVTLKTMTRKLTQRKRVIRRLDTEYDQDEGLVAGPSSDTPSQASSSKSGSATQLDHIKHRAEQGKSARTTFGLQDAFTRSKKAMPTPVQKDEAPKTLGLGLHVSGEQTAAATNQSQPRSSQRDSRDSNVQLSASSNRTRSGLRDSRQQPQAPPRGNSKLRSGHSHALQDDAHKMLPEPPASKRRSRALSITSVQSFSSRIHTSTTSSTPRQGEEEYGPGSSYTLFPKQHLVTNLRRFMRHASAAYGQNFMRIFGIGEADVIFGDTTKHHSNVYSFCHHVGIPTDHVLLSSYTEGGEAPFHSPDIPPVVNYVSIDDVSKAIVLTCRGTLGLSDILTDLTCEFEDTWVDGGRPDHVYKVHAGMAASARRLASPGTTVHKTLRLALESRPDYGLVLTGHSLGAGVTSMLALDWSSPADVFQQRMLARPEDAADVRHPRIYTPFVTSLDSGLPAGRPIHCFAYGPPAIMTPDLSRYCRGLITSVVHAFDIVPCLSLGTLHDLKRVAASLSHEQESAMAQEVLGRVVGLYQRRRRLQGDVPTSNAQGAPAIDATPRPTDVPLHEREQELELKELAAGRPRNRAGDPGYKDPRLTVEPEEATSAPTDSTDGDLTDWLWSLIKTMRADMSSLKLVPPGQVLCIEAWAVYVTPKTRGGSTSMRGPEAADKQQSEAHRVVLRQCEDVEKRFAEPIFARSMIRDHVPTSYELCTQLLFDSVISQEEREETDHRESRGES
ncbi:hypothetical protein IE81DRAFT_368901 [Ceraceosorus guamensis]|uniref:sn-1-specific diacylglycerol lipase n=1 Tax=Ceraceosorus guamensis TaxID=1522189 RepID=A0A316VQ03_9BASI|nr:hypothetical protein IE81DRAFT_368901 [Ceraceosorus guamensis]PWN39666.1 hypothetical protein IE81DRAFT_368901 [Ceraceosorus guamensis]